MYQLKNILPTASYSSRISLRPGFNIRSPEASGKITSFKTPLQKEISVIKPTAMKKLRLNVNPFLLLVFPLLLASLSGIYPVKNRSFQNAHSDKEAPKTDISKEIEKGKNAGRVSDVPSFLLYKE